jgi:hypothetical protein
MFQHYAQNVDPRDERFLDFISSYLAGNNVQDPKKIPYTKLYGIIKQGIRRYIAQHTPEGQTKRARSKTNRI